MMITVNLRPGQKRKRAGGGGKEFVDRFRRWGPGSRIPCCSPLLWSASWSADTSIWGFVV